MQSGRVFAFTLVAALAAVLLPRGLTAQQPVQLDFRGGISVPGGDLSNFVGVSPGFTIGVDYPVHERISLRVDGGADIFSGDDIEGSLVSADRDGPDLSVTRFTGGAVFHVLADDDNPLVVDANLGGGVGILTSSRTEYSLPGGGVAIVDLSEVYFTGEGGLLFGYRLGEQVSAFVSAQAYLTLADEEDTSQVGLITDEGAPETLWSFPLSAGLKFSFPR